MMVSATSEDVEAIKRMIYYFLYNIYFFVETKQLNLYNSTIDKNHTDW